MRSIAPWRFFAVALAAAAPAAADLFGYRPQVLYPAVVLDEEFAYNRFGAATASGDFDGDGDDDLAVGTPATDHTPPGGPAIDEAGSVQVYRARESDFEQLARRQLTQQDFGVAAEPFDHFGEVLATGDFDDDGYDDLALGVPGENIDLAPVRLDAGMVQVVYGSALGLDTDRTATATLDLIGTTAGDNDNFGAALAAGDFDGDGFDDLAIGAPGRDVGALEHAGWVIVVYGSAAGLVWSDHEHLHQDVAGVLGVAAAQERFGAALAAADFGGVGPDDLAIGVPTDTAAVPGGGAIHVLYGASAGLLPADGDQFLHQNWIGVDGDAETGDRFGEALAAGDFDDDGVFDLAVGVPGQDRVTPTPVADVGQVHLFYGDPAGYLTLTGNAASFLPCVCGCPQMGGGYGQVLAAGDVDDAGGDDLVIGMPLGNRTEVDAGYACVRYGTHDQQIYQALSGLGGGDEAGDRFASSLAVGRTAGRRYVAFGIPFEEVSGGPADEGRLAVLFDALFADGFASGDTTVWSATVP